MNEPTHTLPTDALPADDCTPHHPPCRCMMIYIEPPTCLPWRVISPTVLELRYTSGEVAAEVWSGGHWWAYARNTLGGYRWRIAKGRSRAWTADARIANARRAVELALAKRYPGITFQPEPEP